jgi:multisubunit Na+/H+ antiporter MnhB subunit
VQRAYLASTRALSVLLLVLGVAMVVSALVRGGGALALGVVLGTMFTLLGAARLWLARGRDR